MLINSVGDAKINRPLPESSIIILRRPRTFITGGKAVDSMDGPKELGKLRKPTAIDDTRGLP